MARRTLQILLFLLCVSILPACSDYQRRWEAHRPASTKTGRIDGSYEGMWESKRYRGANGKLWCILTQVGPDSYRAEFRATWHGIFSSRHTVVLRALERRRHRGEMVVKLAGSMQIKMWIGSGNYTCTAEITGSQFTAHYDAEMDQGIFTLQRRP